jgi:hypothetical protein
MELVNYLKHRISKPTAEKVAQQCLDGQANIESGHGARNKESL